MAGDADLDRFMAEVERRNPHEPEFLQAVREVVHDVLPVVAENRAYREARILDRLTEPERAISFRVTWVDDAGAVQMNRGYRFQWSGAIGPYKGGLRFHPSVNPSILKFLGFEQTFKNALTTLPMGGGKGGSDFDPHGRSDGEVMRFCQAFMTELFRHVGPETDVPAGDIGVGAREIGFLFGQYRRLANEFTGVLTGKAPSYGGSLIRPEATGFGLVYFAREMLAARGDELRDKTCVVTGSGNVALHTVEKLLELGARAVTLSDSDGFVHDPKGIDAEKLAWVIELKERRRGRIREYVDKWGGTYHVDARPWNVPCDLAFPCATQNEIEETDAKALVANGCRLVAEGANMPSTAAAAHVFLESRILYAPSKAANAGGVAVSGLEMSQNAIHLAWRREEVDSRLHEIMRSIHGCCVGYGREGDHVNYLRGANRAGFAKVADAMLAQGIV
ncbi:MAG: NADP-specific glutamate dehydrogenase [Myxococcota bacterium]